MSERERRLWIDAKGRPVITTTANGARNATRWGWTPATAIPVSDGGCEAAYQRIKAEEATHWRISEHAAFEQGWKACQADTRARSMTERDGERLDQIVRDAYGYWPPARAEILKLIEAVRQEEREKAAQVADNIEQEARAEAEKRFPSGTRGLFGFEVTRNADMRVGFQQGYIAGASRMRALIAITEKGDDR